MASDPEMGSWVLEFVLRQPIRGALVQSFIDTLPLPSSSDVPLRVRRAILHRRLADELVRRSITHNTLQSIELLHALRPLPSSAAADAFCAVAVHLTADASEFPNTVGELWGGRIARLLRSPSAAGLASDRLRSASREMGLAVSDPDLRSQIRARNTKNRALNAVRDFLQAEYEDVGPPVLELAAGALFGEGAENVPSASGLGRTTPTPPSGAEETPTIPPSGAERARVPPPPGAEEAPATLPPPSGAEEEEAPTIPPSGAEQAQVPPPPPGAEEAPTIPPPPSGAEEGEAPAVPPSGAEEGEASTIPPSGGVEEETPTVLPSSGGEEEETQRPHEIDGGQLGKGTASIMNEIEGSPNEEVRPTMMEQEQTEQGRTARTHDQGGSSDPLHNQKRKAISAKPVERKKMGHRRIIKRWSIEEEDSLRKAVKEFGKGNWKEILNNYSDIFEGRTEVDLKDKWRNMIR